MNQVDLYAACPCGSGAKIKFCCCKDIAQELGKTLRMIEGDQLRAAQDHLKRLLQKYPGRAALLALLCDVTFELDPNGDFVPAAREFAEKHPDNLAAVSWGAIAELVVPRTAGMSAEDVASKIPSADEVRTQVRRSAQRVQQALELFSNQGADNRGDAGNFPLLSSLELLVQTLFRIREFLPAIAYERLLVALLNGDERAAEALRAVLSDASIPLFVRAMPLLGGCSPQAPYVAEYAAAKRLADIGAWQAALDQFRPLAQAYPQQQELLKAVALLSSLTLDPNAVAAWRAYAAIPGLNQDDAVEAEALAQYLTSIQSPSLGANVIAREYAVTDANLLMERLLSDKRWVSMPVQQAEEGVPPPKGLFIILDRPSPAEGAPTSLADTPRLLGQASLYGRETDKDARIELVANAAGDLIGRIATIAADTAKELLGPQISQKELPYDAAPSLAFEVGVPRLYMQNTTDREAAIAIRDAWFRDEVLPAWLDRPQAALQGSSPRQAAAKPELRNALLAVLMNLHYGPNLVESALLAEESPEKALGLPAAAPIDPTTAGLQSLPAVRWSRLEVSKLSDDALAGLLNMATVLAEPEACQRMSAEVLARPAFQGKPLRATALQLMASAQPVTSPEFLMYLHQARQAMTDAGQSPLGTYFTEMRARLSRGEPEEFRSLVDYVLKKWSHDREAMSALAQFLASMGLLRGQGPGAAMPPGAEAEAVAAAPAAPASSGLWTPDGGAPAQPAGETKSKLWVPGQ